MSERAREGASTCCMLIRRYQLAAAVKGVFQPRRKSRYTIACSSINILTSPSPPTVMYTDGSHLWSHSRPLTSSRVERETAESEMKTGRLPARSYRSRTSTSPKRMRKRESDRTSMEKARVKRERRARGREEDTATSPHPMPLSLSISLSCELEKKRRGCQTIYRTKERKREKKMRIKISLQKRRVSSIAI